MLANHGKKYRPVFVDRITTYDGQLVRHVEPELLSQEDYPAAYWKVLEDGMKQVFVTGFDGVSYSVARKTGTSQQQVAGQSLENAVFIAYAPADKPKLAVAVVIPEGGFGSWGAAPIARQIFDAYDEHYGLYGVPKNGK
ncbi:Penicillin-binding protein 2B [compost metagenome]